MNSALIVCRINFMNGAHFSFTIYDQFVSLIRIKVWPSLTKIKCNKLNKVNW